MCTSACGKAASRGIFSTGAEELGRKGCKGSIPGTCWFGNPGAAGDEGPRGQKMHKDSEKLYVCVCVGKVGKQKRV